MIEKSELTSDDIQMSKGYAIITMLLLHLFCLDRNRVYGSYILSLNNGVPILYYIGWLCAICAPTYCICSGYAHYRQGQVNGLIFEKREKRILKFLISYWIVVISVSIFGIICKSDFVPKDLIHFIFNFCLLSWSYTGIWWYAFVYVLYVIFSNILFRIVNRTSSYKMFAILILQFLLVESAQKVVVNVISENSIIYYFWIRIYYLLGARLLCYMGGMIIAKENVITKIKCLLDKIRYSNLVITFLLFVIAIGLCIINKGILIVLYTFPVFIGFNLLNKRKHIKSFMENLGRLSTFIWFVHPFIYSNIFPIITELWLKLKYSVLLFVGLLIICIIISIPLDITSKIIIKKVIS